MFFAFLLAVPAAWFLYIMISHRLKGTIPQWLHKYLHKKRHDATKQSMQGAISAMPLFMIVLGLMFCPTIVMWFISYVLFPNGGEINFRHYPAGWAYFSHSTTLTTIAAIAGIFFPFWVGKGFRKFVDHYTIDVVKEEEKETIRQAYGVKGFATHDDIVKHLGDPSAGIHIGRNFYWNEKGHALTVGGAGSGKGTNLIIPTLISPHFTNTKSSIVVLDPKGENAAISAPYLKSCGYDVHIINPFGIKEIEHLGNSLWNPLSEIERGEEKRMCDLIAFSIHNRVSQGEGNFWDNKTRQYISLYLQYDMHLWSGNIVTAYEALMWGGSKRIDHLKAMAEDDGFSGSQEASNILDSLMGETAKTEESIYMSIYEAMNIFGDKALQESLGAYEPDFEMRKISKKPTAIFLCIRHSDLRYYAAWVRMFTDILLRTLTKHYNPQRKVVVLLDEFAQLGYVNEFKNSPAVLRGYNVTLWPIVQELGQLQSIYGKDWETFISNAAVKHWLGGGMDNTTAKYLEERMPMDIKFVGNNADGSPREVQTKLMTAEQIMKMEGMIVEIAGMDKPIYLSKMPYYEDQFLSRNASPNPFY